MADSAEYYRTLVEFAATASDDLILAYNQVTKTGFLVSHFPEHVDPTAVPNSLGDFILAIREELDPLASRFSRRSRSSRAGARHRAPNPVAGAPGG